MKWDFSTIRKVAKGRAHAEEGGVLKKLLNGKTEFLVSELRKRGDLPGGRGRQRASATREWHHSSFLGGREKSARKKGRLQMGGPERRWEKRGGKEGIFIEFETSLLSRGELPPKGGTVI